MIKQDRKRLVMAKSINLAQTNNRPYQRNASIEILRILSMLLIIFLHSIIHSGVLEASNDNGTMIFLWVRFTHMLTQVCVNVYVLISGYFLITSKFKLNKLVALWLEVVFYSVAIRLIFIAFGYKTFSIGSILSCFVPVFTGRYWFITIYFGLYLIFPFLNMLIKAMNKKQHMLLCMVLFVLFSVTVSVYPSFAGMNSGAGWGLAWFTVLYIMAAWFRLYYMPNNKWFCKLLLYVGISAVVTVMMLIGNRVGVIGNIASNWYRYDSVPAILSSLCIFTIFLNIRVNNNVVNRIILFISPSTLGVYLIHDHVDASPWSWEILNMPSHMTSYLFPVIQIGVVIGIFVFCIIIDIIRRYTVGRVEKSKILNNLCNYATNKFQELLSKVIKEQS